MELLTKFTTEQIITFGTLVVTTIGWFFRLEAKVNYLEKDHKENKVEVKAKVDSIEKGIGEILVAVGRLEGRNLRVDARE